MSATGKVLWKLLDNEEWWEVRREYIPAHKKTNTEFWMANGPFFFDIHQAYVKTSLELFERHWLWLKARKINNKLRKTEPTIKPDTNKQLAQKLLESICG